MEADTEKPDFTFMEETTIDCADLLERILRKRQRAVERGAQEMILVITNEQARAVDYCLKEAESNCFHREVHVPTMGLLLGVQMITGRSPTPPWRGYTVFGMETIGSDFIGELSPFIL